ncbi:MAG: dihydrofolate reductase family protein [Thermaerobacterales bacterium]
MLKLFPLAAAPPAPDSRSVPSAEAIYDDLELPAAAAARPYIILNMISTLDGKITLDGARVNEIGSSVDHRLMQKLRIPVDAVMRGAGTVRSHGKYPYVPPEDAAARKSRGLPEQPQAVIVSGSCNLPLDAPVFQAAPHRPLIITQADAPPEKVKAARSAAHIIAAGHGAVDLALAVKILREKHNIRSILLEGGPSLNYACLAAGLLDEIFWTLAPQVGGGRSDLTLVTGPQTLDPMPQARLCSAFYHQTTGELFFRYRFG